MFSIFVILDLRTMNYIKIYNEQSRLRLNWFYQPAKQIANDWIEVEVIVYCRSEVTSTMKLYISHELDSLTYDCFVVLYV